MIRVVHLIRWICLLRGVESSSCYACQAKAVSLSHSYIMLVYFFLLSCLCCALRLAFHFNNDLSLCMNA